jgi:uncharacterized protein YyaL (SSP411 family)
MWAVVGIGCWADSESPPPVAIEDRKQDPAAEHLRRGWEVPEAPPGGRPYDATVRGAMRDALESKPADYEPRTHHLRPDGSPLYTNRLIQESSPYLLQHAHNPVDWRPWGGEAFATAKESGRPVLLSVGYSTCHWCHVMERESFEDVEIASFINAHFVPVKVDSEERPDVDAVYMRVLQLLTGGGGWPMTLILTPDRRPVFAGTYFPPRDGDRGTATGLLTILTTIQEQHQRDPESLVAEATRITQRLVASVQSRPGSGIPGKQALEKAVRELSASFDSLFGGFGPAPKFPRSVIIELLLRYHRRTGDAAALHMADYTLERMAAGGIRDQIGGGFHRYSTDARWLVPHFEKMLYDNALLVVAYLDAYQAKGRTEFREIAAEILDYVAREMTDASGAFYTATDAESAGPEGVKSEGRFFTWTPDEVRAAVAKEDVDLVLRFYGVTSGGNFANERSVLHGASNLEVLARKHGLTSRTAASRLALARERLYAARAQRSPPAKDTKIIAAWNGLMISAFARAALAIGDPVYLAKATAAAQWLVDHMTDGEGRVARVWKDGRARHAGVLDDYVFVIASLLDLFEAGGDVRWLEAADRLQRRVDLDFAAPDGGYFLIAQGEEPLLVRLKPDYDGALPSGNSVAAMNLLRLAELTDDPDRRESAERIFRAFSGILASHPSSVPSLMCALDRYLDRPKEIVIVVPDYETGAPRFLAALASRFVPNRALVVVEDGEPVKRLAGRIPWVEDKTLVDDLTTAYVCENRVCKKPTTEPREFVSLLEPVAPYP